MQDRVSTSTSTIAGRPAAAVHREASDDTLVAKVAEGNRLAMHLLFVRHHARVHRFLLRMLGSPAAAEDVSSEVFLAVWQQAGRFRGGSSVSTWLLAIARNKALSELRDRHDEGSTRGEETEIADAAENPELAYSVKRRREILRNCLARPSREHREILDLVYYHDKSPAEVAHILGIPRNTVKTRMFYARKKLSKLIRVRGLLRAGL
ncbi:MAG TPA: sigma-70 family RNA polymerase sigma factor [Xanthobacteraceae bacterium]|jgi:RNA polymerase sigma-70 factor (ECF subfamily)